MALKEYEIFGFVPFEQWEFIEVEFPDADTPVRIQHELKPDDPQDVVYFVCRKSSTGHISDAEVTSVTPALYTWTKDTIILQSTNAGTAKLLVAVPKKRFNDVG